MADLHEYLYSHLWAYAYTVINKLKENILKQKPLNTYIYIMSINKKKDAMDLTESNRNVEQFGAGKGKGEMQLSYNFIYLSKCVF